MSRTGIPQATQSPALPRPAVRPHHSKALSQPLYVCFAFLQTERRRRIFSSVPHAFYYHNTWSRLQVNRLLLFFENIFQAGFTRASLEKGNLLLNRFKSRFSAALQRRRKRLPDRKSWSKPPFGKSGNPLFRQPYPQIFHPEFCHWAGGCGQKVGGEAAHCCGEHQLYRQPWYEVERQQPVHHAHSSSDVSLLPATDASLGGTAESASGQFQEFPWALKMGANPERKISSAVVIPQCLLPQGKNRGQAPERRST